MRLNTNPLKDKYPISVRIAGLSGVLGLIFIFLVFPRFVNESEFGSVNQIVIENIDIPQTQQIDNTPPPARHSIPVPTDDEDIADDVIIDDPTSIDETNISGEEESLFDDRQKYKQASYREKTGKLNEETEERIKKKWK